ncbi:MAG: haloacid dehalogenase type II [Myxococcales bacterium]
MPRYQAYAFDLYGTVLDVSGLARRMVPLLPGEDADALLAAWRKAQLQRSWDLNAAGRYEPFDAVTEQALSSVAPRLDARTRARLAEIWLTVPAHPDAAGTLSALRAAGATTAILSNGTAPMIRAALAAAGLAVDQVKSVDEVRVYKPDPRVYALLDALAPRARTLFVSSNAWDADGARRDGRTVAFIDRGNALPGLAPTHTVRALAELPALMPHGA